MISKDKELEKEIDILVRSQGDFLNLIIAMEECSELIKAISKMLRYLMLEEDVYSIKYEKLKENIIEEMADVIICEYMLSKIFNIPKEQMDNMIKLKMERNIKRIEKE